MLFNLPGVMKTGFRSVSYKWTSLTALRSALLMVYGILFAETFFYLPINVIHTLFASGPFFVLLLDYWLYGAPINQELALGMGLSFSGVLLTVLGPNISG